MTRFAILVDAGYLLAASGKLLFGTAYRRRLQPDYPLIADTLMQLATEDCGKEHLRTYWYDGARDLVPTPQQLAIAALPGVKLRLGRLTGEGQKGVDSRIVRDLIMLSVERAISDAYLLGGDEDLREGVSEAQERGVRVVLLGIEHRGEQNLSPNLAMEADQTIILDAAFLGPLFRLDASAKQSFHNKGDSVDLTRLGSEWATAYLEGAGAEDQSMLHDSPPGLIPPAIDQQLLADACRALGAARLDKQERAALREGFWTAIPRTEKPGGAPQQ